MNEKEHTSEHMTHNKSFAQKARSNPWMLSTFALLVILIAFVTFSELGGHDAGQDEVAQKLVTYLNAQTGGGVTLQSVEESNGLYKVTVNYQGQAIPVYATLDGENLVSDVIPLDGSAPSAGAGTGTVTSAEVSVGDAPVIGDADAPVTVIEFSDFSCPFCAAASGDNPSLIAYMKGNNPSWEPVVTNLMKDYVQTGKVRFAVKYSFGHSGGHPAQLVAWCLNDQNPDLYWKFYAKAFATYDLQNQGTQEVEDEAKMIALAKTISGVNAATLQQCVDSDKFDARFDREQAEGQAAGAQGTPAFFVNGQLVSGAVPYSQFKTIVDAKLAAA